MIFEIIGTRPETGRINPYLKSKIVFTGQHFESNMNHLDEFAVKPDYFLNGHKFYEIYKELDELYSKEKPDLTIVHGDTNSALAGAMVSTRYHIPVAHIEAGCRSGDVWAIEEQNRKMIARIANYHFAPTVTAWMNLKDENVWGLGIFVGDVMYDLFLRSKYKKIPLRDHILLTIHRAENVDNKDNLEAILSGIKDWPTILPLHPRTKKRIKEFGLKLPPSVKVTKPMSYAQMRLWECSVRAIVTDSGGIQREAYWSQTPCITVRRFTEWPETIAEGWNVLVGANSDAIKVALENIQLGNPGVRGFGDGNAHQLIAKEIKGYQ